MLSRSREGAWIEMGAGGGGGGAVTVAPARERGLKFKWTRAKLTEHRSLPRGSVD